MAKVGDVGLFSKRCIMCIYDGKCQNQDMEIPCKNVEEYSELQQKLDIEEKNSLAFQRAYLEMQDKYSKQTRELDIYQKSSSSKQKTIESTQKKLDDAKRTLTSALQWLASPDDISELTGKCNEQNAFDEIRECLDRIK